MIINIKEMYGKIKCKFIEHDFHLVVLNKKDTEPNKYICSSCKIVELRDTKTMTQIKKQKIRCRAQKHTFEKLKIKQSKRNKPDKYSCIHCGIVEWRETNYMKKMKAKKKAN